MRKRYVARHRDGRFEKVGGWRTDDIQEAQVLGWNAPKKSWDHAELVEVVIAPASALNSNPMRDLYEAHAGWSERTFGTTSEKGPIGPLRHLIKEAQEAIEATDDASEFVDCLFLVWDAARRAGFGWDDLRMAGDAKFAKLLTRSYAKDTSDSPVEHDRSLD